MDYFGCFGDFGILLGFNTEISFGNMVITVRFLIFTLVPRTSNRLFVAFTVKGSAKNADL